LQRFAQWQADWAADGWRIERVETGPGEGNAALIVDDRPMGLRGRIDRIDRHETTGRRIIFDYKTSDGGASPGQTHYRSGRWIDLQLPLYRHLVRGMGIDGPVETGYIVLPKDIGKVGHLLSGWSEEELAEADKVAAEVVRNVRAEKFFPPVAPPPAFSEEFAAVCQDGQFGAALAAAEEGEGEP